MAQKHIKQAAVIGAGTMGSQIAAVIANTDTPVLLLDVVPKGANDRDQLAKKAIEGLKQGKSLFTEAKANNIQPGNMEDDLHRLRQVDWVIECVPENDRIKHETYEKVGAYTGEHTLVSSNTSTIPLRRLREGLNGDLQKRLCITHFFNPPWVMPLLELVTDQDNDPQAVDALLEFADKQLGRNVVLARDTPGFIANRIGMFWLLAAMEEAMKEGISIEMADAVMNGAFGFPRTGVFALADLIGLKVLPDIVKSMCGLLPRGDGFCQLKDGLELVRARIGAAGSDKPVFYRKTPDGVQALDLETGTYRPARQAHVDVRHWHEFLSEDKPESRFAGKVLTKLLGYASQVAPEIADNILDIDAAMRDGFGWKYGPFEMIDRLGASWLADQMIIQGGMHPSPLLQQAEAQGFYPQRTGMGRQYLGFSGRYRAQKSDIDKWMLVLKTAGSRPVIENEAARLWDIDGGVACFEITTHMGVIGERVLDALVQAVDKAEADFASMIIGHDGRHFSAGFDLHIVIESARKNDWKRIERIIRQGQDAMLRVKYARVPVIAAIFGYTLGGACEMTMHCAGAQAHSLVHLGLVEADIGVIPAWGGTKEHLWDAVRHGGDNADAICGHALRGFREIAAARKSHNAQQAFDMSLLHDPSRITANRLRLLPEAKALAQHVAQYYRPRMEQTIEAPVAALHELFVQEVEALCEAEPGMELHRKKTLHMLAETASGMKAIRAHKGRAELSARAGWNKLSERQMLDSTREVFMELVRTEEALEKIRKVVKS